MLRKVCWVRLLGLLACNILLVSYKNKVMSVLDLLNFFVRDCLQVLTILADFLEIKFVKVRYQ